MGVDGADDERATGFGDSFDDDDFCRLPARADPCNWSVPETVDNWSVSCNCEDPVSDSFDF